MTSYYLYLCRETEGLSLDELLILENEISSPIRLHSGQGMFES